VEVWQLVQEVKTAIRAYQWEFDDLIFSQVDLELTATLEIGVGGTFTYKIVEVSGDLARKHAQTLSIALIPPEPKTVRELLVREEYSGELFDAFKAIRYAVLKAGEGQPVFTLKEGKITLNFSVKESGGIKVFFGLSGSNEQSQTIAVTVSLPKAP
jgi:hypothetical protein